MWIRDLHRYLEQAPSVCSLGHVRGYKSPTRSALAASEHHTRFQLKFRGPSAGLPATPRRALRGPAVARISHTLTTQACRTKRRNRVRRAGGYACGGHGGGHALATHEPENAPHNAHGCGGLGVAHVAAVEGRQQLRNKLQRNGCAKSASAPIPTAGFLAHLRRGARVPRKGAE